MPSESTLILPPRQERTLLYGLAAVQFTHIMDFMIMMPLGARLMEYFGITPAQFTWLVAAYGLAAATTGFIGSFLLDRFDRKHALLVLYLGFGIATLGCAVAPSFWTLLAARVVAGGCGGVAGSVVTAMVGDVVPPERRGRAMGTVMSAFPLASVLGLPTGLALSNWFDWNAPFFLIAGLSAVVWIVVARALPLIPRHRSVEHPVRQVIGLLSVAAHRRALVLSAVLVFAGGSVIPFMAPVMEVNVGIRPSQIPWIYAVGGACTFFTMPYMGRLADRHDKIHVLTTITGLAAVAVVILTNLPPVPLPVAVGCTTLFFIGMSGRFAPAMAMVTNAVEARYRGGFMSLQSAVQQTSSAVANITAGVVVTVGADGHLRGYPTAGLIALTGFALTLWLAVRLRSIAPHAARNPARVAIPPGVPPSSAPVPTQLRPRKDS